MKGRAYSIDLRERIRDCSMQGMKQSEICRQLKVSRSSVNRILIRYKETGEVGAKKPLSTRRRKVDYEAVREYIKKNPDDTLAEIGAAFKIKNVSYIMSKLKYTYKKKIFIRGEKGRFAARVYRETRSSAERASDISG